MKKRFRPSAFGMECCLWRIWEAHLPGLDPRKRLTAFRAGVSIFNELLAHGKHHSLAEHIGSQLYEYLGTANTQLLLVGSRWHPLDEATALRLQELWARRSQTGWPVMDRS